MVIKDLLNKVSSPSDPNDPKVRQLRDKLAKLQGSQEKPVSATQQPTSTPAPQQVSKPGADMDALAKASASEQRAFAESQDPHLIVRQERTHKLVAKQVNELIELTTGQEKRLKKMEMERQSAKREIEQVQKKNEEIVSKMELIDRRLEKFMGLYEIITNKYNPFADKIPSAPGAPPATVKLADTLTGAENHVEIEQGALSTENQAKLQKLLSELQADEWEKKDLDTEEQVDEVTVREEEILPDIKVELHAILGEFEDRIKKYVDESMDVRLHETISRLEGVLNQEIENAVKENLSELKDSDDIIKGAMEELEELTPKPSEEEKFHDELESLGAEITQLNDEIKAIPPSLYFKLADGRVLKSKNDLMLALQTMPAPVFEHHVSKTHNHFADWLELALHDPLGEQLREKSRQEMVQLLQG